MVSPRSRATRKRPSAASVVCASSALAITRGTSTLAASAPTAPNMSVNAGSAPSPPIQAVTSANDPADSSASTSTAATPRVSAGSTRTSASSVWAWSASALTTGSTPDATVAAGPASSASPSAAAVVSIGSSPAMSSSFAAPEHASRKQQASAMTTAGRLGLDLTLRSRMRHLARSCTECPSTRRDGERGVARVIIERIDCSQVATRDAAYNVDSTSRSAPT